jgi:predicted component of type VI protein secretion system
VKENFEFGRRLNRLIARVEAWNYADSDAGARLPVEVARELKALAASAASPGLKQGVRRAQDALDDGLSAEAVAGALYQVRAELDAGGVQGFSPPPPSPSR